MWLLLFRCSNALLAHIHLSSLTLTHTHKLRLGLFILQPDSDSDLRRPLLSLCPRWLRFLPLKVELLKWVQIYGYTYNWSPRWWKNAHVECFQLVFVWVLWDFRFEKPGRSVNTSENGRTHIEFQKLINIYSWNQKDSMSMQYLQIAMLSLRFLGLAKHTASNSKTPPNKGLKMNSVNPGSFHRHTWKARNWKSSGSASHYRASYNTEKFKSGTAWQVELWCRRVTKQLAELQQLGAN